MEINRNSSVRASDEGFRKNLNIDIKYFYYDYFIK